MTKLCSSRPYTARKRLLEAIRRHDGKVARIAREFGVYRWIGRLGLTGEARNIRMCRRFEHAAVQQGRRSLWRALVEATPAGREARRRRCRRHRERRPALVARG
jgi:hypothetical protein